MATKRAKTHKGKPADVAVRVKAGNALTLALAGYDWATIARMAGYSGKGAAFNAVKRELQRTLQPLAEEYRALELLRLDALLTVYWPKAMDGDGWSMDRVLRLMERRAALLGLDRSEGVGVSLTIPRGKRIIIEDAQDVPPPPALITVTEDPAE
jgi:hypothetical protein